MTYDPPPPSKCSKHSPYLLFPHNDPSYISSRCSIYSFLSLHLFNCSSTILHTSFRQTDFPSITTAFLHFDFRSHTNSYCTLPPVALLQPLAFPIVHIRALIGCFCCCLSLGHLRRPGKGRQPPHSLWCHHHAPPRLSINPHLWLCVSETRFNRER